LWHRDDVEIVEPSELVADIKKALDKIEVVHG
jgi:hypothetical protein